MFLQCCDTGLCLSFDLASMVVLFSSLLCTDLCPFLFWVIYKHWLSQGHSYPGRISIQLHLDTMIILLIHHVQSFENTCSVSNKEMTIELRWPKLTCAFMFTLQMKTSKPRFHCSMWQPLQICAKQFLQYSANTIQNSALLFSSQYVELEDFSGSSSKDVNLLK